MSGADLHIHSNYSDGKLKVNEIIRYAKEMNLEAISITDHDTLTGTIEAINHRDRGGLEVIPGIEFSTVYKGEEIHILGYLFDYTDLVFSSFTKEMQNHREKRALSMIDKFNAKGINITMDELIRYANGDSVGRPHFARLLMDKGYAKNINDSFSKYLLSGSEFYVERFKLSPQETIEMIKKAKGISVLAHPGLVNNQELLTDIINMNIDGIEVYHSKHNNQQVREYYSLAKKNHLLITGGSDCHSSSPNEKPFIGSVKISYSYIEKLKQLKVEKCL